MTGLRDGYSLMEVLVVVAILGVAASIGVPSVGRMVERYEAQTQVRTIEAGVSQLRLQASVDRRSYSAEDIAKALNEQVSEGWRVSAPEELTINEAGFCTGGELLIEEAGGRAWRRQLSKGECRSALMEPRRTGFGLVPRPRDEA